MDRARRIAVIGMVVSALLAVMKVAAGLRAHSASVSADGMESAADVFVSGLVFAALTIAALPPDKNHPYGHGRIETLTGLLIGFLLLVAGCLIAWHGLTGAGDVREPPAVWAVWPLLISMGAKFVLVYLKFGHGTKIQSSSLVADASNNAIDILSGAVALVALSLTLYDPSRFLKADHYGAAAVGFIVIVTATRVIHDTSLHLMDTMPNDELMRRVREVALSVADVEGVEKCYARKTGLKYHVDLHLEVDPDITVRASHLIAERVRDHIRRELPWVADVLVHVEPWQGLAAAQGELEE